MNYMVRVTCFSLCGIALSCAVEPAGVATQTLSQVSLAFDRAEEEVFGYLNAAPPGDWSVALSPLDGNQPSYFLETQTVVFSDSAPHWGWYATRSAGTN